MHPTTPADPSTPADPVAPAEAPHTDPARRVPLLGPFRGAPGWRGALREFAVIVAGVLCALGAQAWWEGRQERGRERDYLRQLLADTRENERRLDRAVAEDSATGIYIHRVVGALYAPGPLPPADSLLRWTLRIGAASDFQPLGGTYGALLTTGDLRLVRNDTLRARLVAYAAALESESHRLRQLREATIGVAGPLARSVPFMRGIFLGELHAGDADFERLRGDGDAWAVLLTVQAANANRLAGLRRAREETRRTRRALEAEPVRYPAR